MTNGRGSSGSSAAAIVGMASFMTKKKKYKFQVEVHLEELLEVPFVSAVLFAKLRLLDGGNFQDHSRREEVRDHTVKWGARYSFPCKMLANASTGVLERCALRISVRKECKGGKSFTKLGFVDLNLAEFAGAGETCRKALLEGYDTRHRQDNSMLKIAISMNMLSGDFIFKVPSPTIKQKPVPTEESAVLAESRVTEEFSGGSLAGSIASGSSGFGSLPKKRAALLSSDLVTCHTLNEDHASTVTALTLDNFECLVSVAPIEHEENVGGAPVEHGHSRNSSNTSQMSKGSGYSSGGAYSHSRQSSSGDSGHIREQHKAKRGTTLQIPSTFPEHHHQDSFSLPNHNNNNETKSNSQTPDEVFGTPRGSITPFMNEINLSHYHTPKTNLSDISDDFRTPNCTNLSRNKSFNDDRDYRKFVNNNERNSFDNNKQRDHFTDGVLRSKSDFEIPRNAPVIPQTSFFQKVSQKSDNLFAMLTPLAKRRFQNLNNNNLNNHSTPLRSTPTTSSLKITPGNNKHHHQQIRTISLNSLKSAMAAVENHNLGFVPMKRALSHRKLLDGGGNKLAPMAISPDETFAAPPLGTDAALPAIQTPAPRRPSITQNPSSGSLALSETGSLDRAKAALERRKKNQNSDSGSEVVVAGRVEGTRVNTDHLIDEIIKNTNFEPADDSAETSGLQLFIAKDGTTALGGHDVKSQVSSGVFKQVVVEDNR